MPANASTADTVPGSTPGSRTRLFEQPGPAVALGSALAVLALGITPAGGALATLWATVLSPLLPASVLQDGTARIGLLVWSLLSWFGVVTGLTLLARGTLRRWSLRIQAGAAAGVLLLTALVASVLTGQAAPVALQLAACLGGLGGLALFGQWQQAQALKRAELKRQMALALQQAKAEFLGQVSRELRTPVNAVVGMADLLTETGLDGEQRRHLEAFRHSAEALTQMLEDLNDLARIEAGRVKLKATSLALVPLLHELVSQVRPAAQAKGVQVQLSLAADLPRMVQGDVQRLKQVLSHLLGQAVKVTRQGRVNVEARPQARDPKRIRFAITDTSLSPVTGKLAGMLEPFGAVGAARSKGTGIGLTLARRVADLMGGKLSVRHSPGKGTTVVFTVSLPALQADGAVTPLQPIAATEEAATQPMAALTSVLLVDDNISTRHLIESMLDKRAFHVVACANGREALQAMEIAPYDVVLMDLHMPEVDGWQALRVIRRLESERQMRRTPVIALGTAPFEVERQRCLDAGFDQHLCKPLRKSRLLESIDRVTSAPIVAAEPAATPARTGALRYDQRDSLNLLSQDGLIDVRTAVESLGGDASLYLDAIEHLAPALNNWPRRFRETLDRQDLDRARQMAQDMQGILEVVGAAAAAGALAGMAQALKQPDDLKAHATALGELDKHLVPLVQTLQATVERLRLARQDRARKEQGHNSAF